MDAVGSPTIRNGREDISSERVKVVRMAPDLYPRAPPATAVVDNEAPPNPGHRESAFHFDFPVVAHVAVAVHLTHGFQPGYWIARS